MAKTTIHISEKTEGSFTRYCRNKGYDGVTAQCIAEGKRSKNPKTRKRAVFAENSRKFKHGGK